MLRIVSYNKLRHGGNRFSAEAEKVLQDKENTILCFLKDAAKSAVEQTVIRSVNPVLATGWDLLFPDVSKSDGAEAVTAQFAVTA